MANAKAKKFYNSAKWKRCRDAYIASRVAADGGLCEVCGMQPGYIVHHKIWLTEANLGDPDVTLNFANLRYECLDCHNREREDGTLRPALPRYSFDEDGDLVPAAPLERESFQFLEDRRPPRNNAQGVYGPLPKEVEKRHDFVDS